MKHYVIGARPLRQFQRAVSRPAGINSDSNFPSFSMGVPTLTVPRAPAAKDNDHKVRVKCAT